MPCEIHNFTTYIWQLTILVFLPNNCLHTQNNCNILPSSQSLLIFLNSSSKTFPLSSCHLPDSHYPPSSVYDLNSFLTEIEAF